MSITMKKFAAVAFIAVLLGMSYGYLNFNPEHTPSITITVTGYDMYGDAVVDATTEDVLDAGFTAGDTISMTDQNGVRRDGVVSDFWTCLFVGDFYMNYNLASSNITIGREYIDRVFEIGDVIKVEKTGVDPRSGILLKYVQGCIEEQGEMPDEVFANFRAVTTGNIVDGMLFRSASPFYSDPRYPIVDELSKGYGIKTVVDLADSASAIEKRIDSGLVEPGYVYDLYKNGQVLPANSGTFCLENQFSEAVKEVFGFIADNDGPYQVFCELGKDRTGMVMMLLEAITGATVDEIIDDYMVSYTNLYGITDGPEYDLLEAKMAKRTLVMMLDTDFMMSHDLSEVDARDIHTVDPYTGALAYLTIHCGIDEDVIDAVVDKLTK